MLGVAGAHPSTPRKAVARQFSMSASLADSLLLVEVRPLRPAFVWVSVQQRICHTSVPRALSIQSCRLSNSSLWLNEQLSSANNALDSNRSSRLWNTAV